MKNIFKRIAAVFAVLAVASMSFTGCSGKEEKSSSVPETSAPQQYPFVVGEAANGNGLTPGDPNADLNANDPIQPTKAGATDKEDTEPVTEIEEVTEADGSPATVYVPVTEASGEKATEADGAVATQAVPVTNIVTKPAATAPKETQPAYTSKEDGRYAMWLDISKDENFFFEGNMITASFKVKDNIPNGDYTIRISPDLSDVAGVAVKEEKTIDGIIRVNNGRIDPVDVKDETGMIFYGDAIACKQGDTIDFNINIKNNSGLVAFCIWFYFDSNALEFIEAYPSGEFEEVARYTEIGGSQQ